MLVIGELSGIQVHAMIIPADFVLDMRLSRVGQRIHLLTAARAVDILDFVVCFTDFGVSAIDKVRHPFVLEDFRFTDIEPHPFAIGALIQMDVALKGSIPLFFHLMMAFRTLHGRIPRW